MSLAHFSSERNAARLDCKKIPSPRMTAPSVMRAMRRKTFLALFKSFISSTYHRHDLLTILICKHMTLWRVPLVLSHFCSGRRSRNPTAEWSMHVVLYNCLKIDPILNYGRAALASPKTKDTVLQCSTFSAVKFTSGKPHCIDSSRVKCPRFLSIGLDVFCFTRSLHIRSS